MSQTLRVSTIRSQSPAKGAIFTGLPIDAQGNVIDAGSYYVVRARSAVLATPVQIGQWWRVVGAARQNSVEVNGYRVQEWQIEVTDLELVLPSGEHIVTLLAESDEFVGIGIVKARRLWERFRDRLYEILDQGDTQALTEVLSEECARRAFAAWANYGDTRTLRWLQQAGFSISLGRKVLEFFGAEAPAKITEEPYRLLSFCGAWEQVDSFARLKFGVADDDPRRLRGAVEEALYRLFGEGHTAVITPMLVDRLQAILGVETDTFQWRTLIPDAMTRGADNGNYVIGEGGDLHPLGALVMESEIAAAIAARCANACRLLDTVDVDRLIAEYEFEEDIALNQEQRAAVHVAAQWPFALVLGGAGVGKTTLLKAALKIFDRAEVRVIQMALSGRAAKRMQEATGRPATTIAGFLKHAPDVDFDVPTVLVIDESSMVDVITMSRVCEAVPPQVRMLLIGDPNQLMPVGPGLILHALVAVPGVPQVELLQVKRYGGAIAHAAHEIRQGRWPRLSDDKDAPIAFIPCASTGIPGLVANLYAVDAPRTQILSARKQQQDGTLALNAVCQRQFTGGAKRLEVWSDEHCARVGTGFHVGDLLLCTRNLWDLGLQNGSLGRLVEVEDLPRLIVDADGREIGYALAWAEWDDGKRRPVFEFMLDDLELGFAITVHKAQGSQWPRVIVVLSGNRLLDRTLVYTAVTRAQEQVLIVGNEQAARQAVERLPRAHSRRVGLRGLLKFQQGNPVSMRK